MQKPSFFWFLVVFAGFPMQARSQSSLGISGPELTLQNEKLIISYGIENSSAKDIFNVWVEVSDENYDRINALSLSGDVGDAVQGGPKKEIIWDYNKDLPGIYKEVFLEVCAELIPQKPKEENLASKDEEIKSLIIPEDGSGLIEVTGSGVSYTRGKALYRSALYPGLGFTGMEKSGLHLIKGSMAYGCLIFSVILNQTAITTYDKYIVATSIEERKRLLTSSKRQDNISEVLAWSAVGIWAIELAWILLEPVNGTMANTALKFSSGVDKITGLPMISLAVSL